MEVTMIQFRFAALLLAGLSVSGCALSWSGHAFDPGVVRKIEVGDTTTTDILEWLGPPQQIVERSTGIRSFIYYHNKSSGFGVPIVPIYTVAEVGRSKQAGTLLNISFGPAGRVLAYEMRTDQDYFFSEPEVHPESGKEIAAGSP